MAWLASWQTREARQIADRADADWREHLKICVRCQVHARRRNWDGLCPRGGGFCVMSAPGRTTRWTGRRSWTGSPTPTRKRSSMSERGRWIVTLAALLLAAAALARSLTGPNVITCADLIRENQAAGGSGQTSWLPPHCLSP